MNTIKINLFRVLFFLVQNAMIFIAFIGKALTCYYENKVESRKEVYMIEKAKAFATKAHEGQFRKGTSRPYIVHPLEVGEIVSHMTDDEEVIAAAILHDTIEDCEEITEEILQEEFGERVATMVRHESEDKTKTWKERKTATIEYLKNAPRELQYIGLADKLSNIRDIARDYPVYGEELWNRFRMKDKNVIGWYYHGIMESLNNLKGMAEYEEYCQLVKANFGENLE